MKKRLNKNRGAAMLWAVAALLITAVVSAGVIMTGASRYNRTLSEVCATKAELLAQSGLSYAIHRITEAEMTGDYSWQPEPDAFEIGIVTLNERRVYFDGERNSDNCALISFEAVKSPDTGGYKLKVISSAEWAGEKSQLIGLFSLGGDGLWQYIGCVD